MAEVEGPGLWADKEKPNWLGVWSHLSHCPSCHTLMNSCGPCPKCGFAFEPMEHRWTDASGATRTHLSMAVPGAFGVTTATLLGLMQREWERPASEDEKSRSFIEQVSPKLILVILFWTLFEHLMDRFFNTAVASLPEGVRDAVDYRADGVKCNPFDGSQIAHGCPCAAIATRNNSGNHSEALSAPSCLNR